MKYKDIKMFKQRCEEHPDHQTGMITYSMIEQRLHEEIDELREYIEQREWVGLTEEEVEQGLLRSDYALQTAHAWRAGVVFAMTKLKEKNNA